MEILKNIILGIVQGLTEFLPVSSSGHLKIFQYIFGFNPESNLFLAVMLHIGTLVAVFIVYHKLIWSMICEFFKSIKDIFTGKFSWKDMNQDRRLTFMVIISTALLGLMIIPLGEYSLKDYFEELNNVESIIPVGIFLMITGIFLLVSCIVSNRYKVTRDNATVKDALIIGGAQCIATISGISRSGSTVCAGLLCGLNREYMVKYSFIMSIPVIIASVLSEGKDAITGEIPDVNYIGLVCGILAAVVSGVLAIKLIQWLIAKDRYKFFGIYCIAVGLITVVCGIIK